MKRTEIPIAVAAVLLFCMLVPTPRVLAGEDDSTILIKADGTVDPPTAPFQHEGDTYVLVANIYGSIVVERDNAVVDCAGHVLEGVEVGIELTYVSNVTVKNAHVKGYDTGILLSVSQGSNIIGNNITSNRSGISLLDSDNNTIEENSIEGNSLCGISLYGSSNTKARNNTLRNNKYNLLIHGGFIHDIDASNTVDGKPVYYWVNEINRIVPDNAGYVALVDCTNITVKNLDLASNGQGILLAYTTNSTVTENSIRNCWDGILIYSSSGNNILGNNITDNRQSGWASGIKLLYYSDSNLISGNSIRDNDNGVWIYLSTSNTVRGNSLAGNDREANLIQSPGNLWYDNDVSGLDHLSQSDNADAYTDTTHGKASIKQWEEAPRFTIAFDQTAHVREACLLTLSIVVISLAVCRYRARLERQPLENRTAKPC